MNDFKTKLIIAIVTILLLTGGTLIYLLAKDSLNDNNSAFVELEEIVASDKVVRTDTFFIQLNPNSSVISIIDLEHNKTFSLIDRDMLITESFTYTTDGKVEKAMKYHGISTKSYPYKFITGNIAILMKESGEAKLILETNGNITQGNLTLQVIGYINDLSTKLARYTSQDISEDETLLFSTNFDVMQLNLITGAYIIYTTLDTEVEGTLPTKLLEQAEKTSLMDTLMRASEYNVAQFSNLDADYIFPLISMNAIGISEDQTYKLYNEVLQILEYEENNSFE